MLGGLTRREQRILLLLIITITAGMAVHHFRDRSRREILYSRIQAESGKTVNSGRAASPKDNTSSQTLLININKAPLEELYSLNGIGEIKARAIIDYREAHDGFKTLEEIIKVPGIGMSTFQKIRERITTGNEDSLNMEIKDRKSQPSPVTETSHIGEETQIPVSPSGKVDINTAGIEELMTLEQIGEVKAQRILNYRIRYGPFHSANDLLKIRGIGEKTLHLNRDRITVGGYGHPK
jgi:competence protein ComEA